MLLFILLLEGLHGVLHHLLFLEVLVEVFYRKVPNVSVIKYTSLVL